MLQVAEFLLDTETASNTAAGLAKQLIVNAHVGSTESEV
jgi:hypothetical protein